ncbi:MAG TPA: ATP-binding protein, partial [Acidimicrobiales bacterium]|nr:ATP-binding protein [Acidimicrobiales bacterium]
MDDLLLDAVLTRLGSAPLLPRPEALLLASLQDDEALEAALGGQEQGRAERIPIATQGAPPARAYLRSIKVEGFRGIGPECVLALEPGPGLTVICGRNGSGKSSFAEAAEILFTGSLSRWDKRSAVWKNG